MTGEEIELVRQMLLSDPPATATQEEIQLVHRWLDRQRDGLEREMSGA